MVTVRLSDNSFTHRLYINPKQEITREEGVAVPLKWAATRLSDRNLFFVFDEEDRKELLGLNERFVSILSKEMGVESLLVEDLVEKLLPSPKKTILPKMPLKKTRAVSKSKSSLKK
tara:strand:+ start:1226 stop:1573 length:348 start_codon:yes stop_codon:yes gene_type:complete